MGNKTSIIAELTIKNFLTIKDAQISFSDAITCFTGQSGSGKSLLVSAIIILFGGDIKIKDGLKNACIRAKINSPEIAKRLSDSGIDLTDEFFLTREFTGKKSRFLINGKIIGKEIIRNIFFDYLITTRQNASYLREDIYINLLSDFDMSDYASLFDKWVSLKKQYAGLGKTLIRQKERYEKSKKLKVKIKQLKPHKGEIDELREKINSIKSSEKLKETDSRINELLYGNANLLANLELLRKLLIQKEEIQGGSLAEKIGDILTDIKELEFGFEDTESGSNLDEIKKRLSDLRMLEFQMSCELDEIMDNFAETEKFIKEYDKNQKALSEIKDEIDKLYSNLIQLADKIHDKRLRTASDIEARLKDQLKKLGIDCSIRFEFLRIEPERFGTDRISLLFSPNPQLELQEVNRIASGGEKSRILLALLTIKAGSRILILDEIDEGTSGDTVSKIASVVKAISEYCQVILVTHKPQIASVADIHYKVGKSIKDNQAVSTIKRLSMKERAGELAALISTEGSTEEAKRYADKLLADNKQ